MNLTCTPAAEQHAPRETSYDARAKTVGMFVEHVFLFLFLIKKKSCRTCWLSRKHGLDVRNDCVTFLMFSDNPSPVC